MRSAIVVVACILCLTGLAAADVTGSFITLLSPTIVAPGQTYTFLFLVSNFSADMEKIADVCVSFPDGFTLYPATMSYQYIVAPRPNWAMSVPPVNHTAMWNDADGGAGEVWFLEATTFQIDATVATQLYGIPLFWCVQGDGSGVEPHRVCGCVELEVSPVESQSWSSIKALYR